MYYKDFQTAHASLAKFRFGRMPRGPHAEEHHDVTLRYAQTAYDADDLETAEVWALRSLHDGPSCAAFMLLADICEGTDDLLSARRWLQAAQGLCKAPLRRYETTHTPAQIAARLTAVDRLLRERWQLRDLWVTPLMHTTLYVGWQTLAAVLRAPMQPNGDALYTPAATGGLTLRAVVPPELDAIVQAPNICVNWYNCVNWENDTRVFKLPIRALTCAKIEWAILGAPLVARLRKLGDVELAAIDAQPALLAKHMSCGWGAVSGSVSASQTDHA